MTIIFDMQAIHEMHKILGQVDILVSVDKLGSQLLKKHLWDGLV